MPIGPLLLVQKRKKKKKILIIKEKVNNIQKREGSLLREKELIIFAILDKPREDWGQGLSNFTKSDIQELY